MPIKALGNSLWGALYSITCALFLLFFVFLFYTLTGNRFFPLDLHRSSGNSFLVAMRLFLLILPLILVSFPFFINQRFPVRGIFRYFFYPLCAALGLFITLLFIAILEFLRLRGELGFSLPAGAMLPFSKVPMGALVLDLRLPDASGHSTRLVVEWFSRFSDGTISLWSRAVVLGFSLKASLVIFAILWTPAVCWFKRRLPQSLAYQSVASFALASASVLSAYSGLTRLFG
jgi:hypothetical protein